STIGGNHATTSTAIARKTGARSRAARGGFGGGTSPGARRRPRPSSAIGTSATTNGAYATCVCARKLATSARSGRSHRELRADVHVSTSRAAEGSIAMLGFHGYQTQDSPRDHEVAQKQPMPNAATA